MEGNIKQPSLSLKTSYVQQCCKDCTTLYCSDAQANCEPWTHVTPVMAHQHQILDLGGLSKLKLPGIEKKKKPVGFYVWDNPYCFIRKSDDCWLCTKLSGEFLSLSLCQAQCASVCWKCIRERYKGKCVALNTFKCLLTEGGKNKAPFEVRQAQRKGRTKHNLLSSLLPCKWGTATPFLHTALFWSFTLIAESL